MPAERHQARYQVNSLLLLLLLLLGSCTLQHGLVGGNKPKRWGALLFVWSCGEQGTFNLPNFHRRYHLESKAPTPPQALSLVKVINVWGSLTVRGGSLPVTKPEAKRGGGGAFHPTFLFCTLPLYLHSHTVSVLVPRMAPPDTAIFQDGGTGKPMHACS